MMLTRRTARDQLTLDVTGSTYSVQFTAVHFMCCERGFTVLTRNVCTTHIQGS